MSEQMINAQQSLVRCAVRDAFRQDRATQLRAAAELRSLAPLLGAEERFLVISDIESELSYEVPADVAGVWDAAHTTLRRTDEAGGDRDAFVPVSESFIVGAVRYAAGRQTYISGQMAEELLRVGDELSPDTSLQIAAVLEPVLARVQKPIMKWDDMACWERALRAVLVETD